MNYQKRKKVVVVLSVMIVTMLVSLLIIVPMVLGSRFVSVSFRLRYYGHPDIARERGWDIVNINGSIISVSWVELTVKVTNSYFVSVQVIYNGFDYVWLIYNRTVSDPTDVVNNKDALVWGAYYGLKVGSFESETAYDYYVARKDISNYTKMIAVGTREYSRFLQSVTPIWYAQDVNGYRVSPGTYYMYYIDYGIVSEPLNVTVTSVRWTP